MLKNAFSATGIILGVVPSVVVVGLKAQSMKFSKFGSTVYASQRWGVSSGDVVILPRPKILYYCQAICYKTLVPL